MGYRRRYLDTFLDEVFPSLPAVAVDGAKGVGKTETASRRAATVLRMDDPSVAMRVAAGPEFYLSAEGPVLIDEWQHLPEIWDVVRRRVDGGLVSGVLLTGSATPRRGVTTHSGAGRIVSVLLRPMSLVERGASEGGVGLRRLFEGLDVTGERTSVTVGDLAEEICASGLPGIHPLPVRARSVALRSYVQRVIDRDVSEQTGELRRPDALRAWMTAYAAASSTTASYTSILDAATPGESNKPSRPTVQGYRDVLTQIWVLDPVPAWTPAMTPLPRLKVGPKHQLADPALAATLLGTTPSALLSGSAGAGELFGQLFESLATLCVRAAAIEVDGRVGHLRTRGGQREVDLVVEDPQGRVLGIEVKLARDPTDADVRHLLWLRDILGDRFVGGVVLTTGTHAYRRPDGIDVVPLALLG